MCSLADWDVFQAKVYTPDAKKAKATPAVYNRGLDAGFTITYSAARSSADEFRTTATTNMGHANKASSPVRSLQTLTAPKQEDSALLPDTQTPYVKIENCTGKPLKAPNSTDLALLPDSQAPYIKTEDHAEKALTSVSTQSLHIKTEDDTENPLKAPKPKTSTFLSDSRTPYIKIEDDDDLLSANVPALNLNASSTVYSSVTQPTRSYSTPEKWMAPNLEPSNPFFHSSNSQIKNESKGTIYCTENSHMATETINSFIGVKPSNEIPAIVSSVWTSKARRNTSATFVNSPIPHIKIEYENASSIIEPPWNNTMASPVDSERLQPKSYIPRSAAPKPTAAMFFFDPPLPPKNPTAKSSLEMEVDRFLDNLEVELATKVSTSLYAEHSLSDGQVSTQYISPKHEDTNVKHGSMMEKRLDL